MVKAEIRLRQPCVLVTVISFKNETLKNGHPLQHWSKAHSLPSMQNYHESCPVRCLFIPLGSNN